MSKRLNSVIDRFIALPDSQKKRVYADIEAETPSQRLARSRPLNKSEQKQWRRFKKMGRPRVGKGAKTISLTVERELLQRADAYAKRHGLSRAMLIAQALRTILGSTA